MRPNSDEFFYINADGEKDDTNLHGPILRAVDFPIIESIMGPIRAKYAAMRRAEKAAEMRKAIRAGDAAWVESRHSRGQPKNKGQFGPGGGGGGPTPEELNERAKAALRMGRESEKKEEFEGGSNAAALYKAPTKTADEIVAAVPGAAEAVAATKARLASRGRDQQVGL